MGAYKDWAEELEGESDDGLGDFLLYLIEFEEITNENEVGVAKAAAGNGVEKLSKKQRAILSSILDRYKGRVCCICRNELTWGEMIFEKHNECEQRQIAFPD